MIQDIAPRKLINHYDPSIRPSGEDLVVCFKGMDILVKDGEELDFPRVSEFEDRETLTYLFSVDEERYFLKIVKEEITIQGSHFENIHPVRGRQWGPQHRIFAAMTAKHLMDWYRDNAYCGRCGKKMHHDEVERAMTCECGYKSYPRIMPAVIVGVTKGDYLLLTRYREGFKHNALIAGFTEIGETLEETVQREVMEEAGIKVKNIRYYKSQPWGIANDILTGFYCDVDGDADIHMDDQELSYAKWVKREDIELQPNSASLTNEMMDMFKQGKM